MKKPARLKSWSCQWKMVSFCQNLFLNFTSPLSLKKKILDLIFVTFSISHFSFSVYCVLFLRCLSMFHVFCLYIFCPSNVIARSFVELTLKLNFPIRCTLSLITYRSSKSNKKTNAYKHFQTYRITFFLIGLFRMLFSRFFLLLFKKPLTVSISASRTLICSENFHSDCQSRNLRKLTRTSFGETFQT